MCQVYSYLVLRYAFVGKEHQMNDLIFILLLIVVLLALVSCVAAYRNGVRDGYQNLWLPHVKKQIKEQKLEQWTITDWSDDGNDD